MLPQFKDWLDRKRIQRREGKGEFQVMQVAWPDGQWNCVYDRIDAPEHYTVTRPMEPLVRRFIQARSAIAQPAASGEPVAWAQLGLRNGHTYVRMHYEGHLYPPPPDVQRNLNLVPLYAAPQPAPARPDMMLVPRWLLQAASDSLGSFVSDHGWAQEDMDIMDSLDAYLASQPAAPGAPDAQKGAQP
jgi:hypothetical protein